MQNCQKLFGLAGLLPAGVVIMAIAVPVSAAAQGPGTPGDPTTPPGRSQEAPVSKSDQHRIVGKVLHIDREQGLVKLATEEGVLVVQPSPPMVHAVKVGDTVSVPRSAAEAPSASPRK